MVMRDAVVLSRVEQQDPYGVSLSPRWRITVGLLALARARYTRSLTSLGRAEANGQSIDIKAHKRAFSTLKPSAIAKRQYWVGDVRAADSV